MKIELFDSNSFNFVELNITGDSDGYVRFDTESKFLDTAVFNIFIDCFEKSDKLYDYFEPTKFNSRNLIPLLKELNNKLTQWEYVSNYEDFEEMLKQHAFGEEFMENLNAYLLKKSWNKVLAKIIDVNKDLIKLVQSCLDNEYTLWVIGY